MTERLKHIDIAKGICIVLVVIGHFMPANAPEWYKVLRDIIYCFHMPLFMYVSGFVYARYQKPIPYKNFVVKKFKRLMLPYFFVSVLVIGIKLLTERNMPVEHPTTLSSFYEMFYLPSAAFFLWFVYVLFLIFLIVPFFQTKRKMNMLFILSAALYLLPVQTTELFCLAQLKDYLFYFVLGCVASQQDVIRNKISSVPWWGLAILFSLFYLLAVKTAPLNVWAEKGMYALLGITGILFILHISHLIDNKTNGLKGIAMQLAAYSYTIYLFHTTFQGFTKAVMSYIPDYILPEYMALLMQILFVNAVGIVGPILLHKIYYAQKRYIYQRK